jgi:hypothetical protein
MSYAAAFHQRSIRVGSNTGGVPEQLVPVSVSVSVSVSVAIADDV